MLWHAVALNDALFSLLSFSFSSSSMQCVFEGCEMCQVGYVSHIHVWMNSKFPLREWELELFITFDITYSSMLIFGAEWFFCILIPLQCHLVRFVKQKSNRLMPKHAQSIEMIFFLLRMYWNLFWGCDNTFSDVIFNHWSLLFSNRMRNVFYYCVRIMYYCRSIGQSQFFLKTRTFPLSFSLFLLPSPLLRSRLSVFGYCWTQPFIIVW